MIATCPTCATRYVVDPAALGREGRTVRCAKCRNTWHLTPPEEALAEAGEAQRPPRYIPGMEVPPAAGKPEAADEAGEGVSAESSVERAARASRRNLPAVRKADRRQMLVAWAALGGALVVFLAILVGLRGPIAGSVPGMAAVYDAVGLGGERSAVKVETALTASDMLAFVSLGLKLEEEGGVPVLTVTGRIRNSAQQRLDLPPVKATLLDADKGELYSWDFEPPAAEIGPGQSLAFSSRLSNPPAGVREAVLTFVSGTAGTAQLPDGE